MLYKSTFLFLGLILFTACNKPQKTIDIKGEPITCELIASDNFSSDLNNWVVEQRPGGTTSLVDGKMDINDSTGCTVWFNKKFEGNILIEYDAMVIENDGPNDRVSDLNCFWMATDINNPNDFFANSENRNGKFQNYHDLRLYYVGLGGHDNTKTRFRRYVGGGERPCLPEHDLNIPEFLITANKLNKIQLIVYNETIQYHFNGQLVFDYQDDNPYSKGYFGIRTYKNHMAIDSFRVYKLIN